MLFLSNIFFIALGMKNSAHQNRFFHFKNNGENGFTLIALKKEISFKCF